ncbi:hypothetical protein [Tsukamurella pseudospumae]|uniref:DUF2530 domain-containing protein n=1 Tax=Tsukamurella pseudospumae TaxID=239498 RepID=A0A137ZZA5_9ACTN|nr:hypothetical protein [Tsukamurella pseudospumae]KXO98025.1 hypothetical protein AXK61_20910 [Tsukamurella pseudospumae]KXP03497.1 hypothetical protein AXK60_16900 [Tsukamurella pseudospumae]
MAEPERGEAVKAAVGLILGAVIVVCCAFTLPRLPRAVEAIGSWPVWGGFAIITVVAGWLFWSNLQKFYALVQK